jgi:putative transposase
MALDQSALLEVLDALKGAEVDDRIRQAAETIYQALAPFCPSNCPSK